MEKKYTMTEEEYQELLEAARTPVMYISGGQSMFGDPQTNANQIWERIGNRMGFKYMTVSPAGNNPREFWAESINEE